MVKTILIADDHHLISDGFKALIQALQPGSRILTCKTAKQVDHYIAAEKNINHIFLDLTLLDAKGLDYVTSLCTKIPPGKICVISGEDSAIVIKTCRNLKISGFISKALSEDELLKALNTVLDGGSYYPGLAEEARNSPANNDDGLSKRQLEVLNLIGQGLANKEIAQQLSLSHETVKVHVRNILAILKAQSRTAAVAIARKQGLI
jgi:two-component system, NarL family, nitrate/nitrite response regulator NarL